MTYTAEMTAAVTDAFVAGNAIEAIAAVSGKSAKSVTAKLVSLGLYHAKAKAKAEAKVTKADLIAKIAAAKGVEAADLETLEKASKAALEILAAD